MTDERDAHMESNTEAYFLLRHTLSDEIHIGRFDRGGYWDVFGEVPRCRASTKQVMVLFDLGPAIRLTELFFAESPMSWTTFADRWHRKQTLDASIPVNTNSAETDACAALVRLTQRYAKAGQTSPGGGVRDLMTDLMFVCDEMGVDFDERWAAARAEYEDECKLEEGEDNE